MTYRFGRTLLLALVLGGCKTIAIGFAADALSGGSSYGTDDDPELVREAVPFGLKTIESLLAADPDNEKLLLAASSGFTQYAYAFVLADADAAEAENPELARQHRARAKKLMRRAHDYGRRSIEAAHKGFWADFGKDRQKALGRLDDEEDVPRLYWTAISLAALITQSKDDMGLVGELPVVEALMGRAYALRPDWDDGAIHEFYISYDGGRSEAMGGSVKKAKEHFDRVMQLTGGKKVGPLVTWAEVVAVEAQNRKEFNELLDKALAFDVDEAPRFRLVNVLAQQKARRLKARADDLFLEE